MIDENKKLLDEVINDRLTKAKDSNVSDEESVAAFKQAMEAIDRRNEIDKQAVAKRDNRLTIAIRIAEVAAAIVIVPFMQHRFNMKYAESLCHFEKDYTFTTTAGKATKSFFNFKGRN